MRFESRRLALETSYLQEMAWLSTEAVGIHIESTGGGLVAIEGDVSFVDGLEPARTLLATNSEEMGLLPTPAGSPWLVGLYDSDGEALTLAAGDTIESAYKTAVGYLVARSDRAR